MEILSLLILLGIGNEINSNADRISELETQVMLQDKWIADLEGWNADQQKEIEYLKSSNLKLSGSIAAVSANSKTTDEALKQTIDNTIERLVNEQSRIDYIDEKINIYHP